MAGSGTIDVWGGDGDGGGGGDGGGSGDGEGGVDGGGVSREGKHLGKALKMG